MRWHTFFSYLASGPPPHRLEELLALAEAGIVAFLGPDVAVTVDDGGFAASSPQVPGRTTARVMIDAWLPAADATLSTDGALRELATVHGSELRVADSDYQGSLGRVRVTEDGRVLRADDTAHDALFAIGPFTSLPEAGAFTRPASDSLSLRQTDRVAGALSARLGVASV